MKVLHAALAALAIASSGAAAHASVILAPVSVKVDSGGEAGMFWTVDNIIDQSGLSKTYLPGVTDFEDYIASGPRHGFDLNTRWLSREKLVSSILTFDFGKVVTLSKLALWDDFATTNSRFTFSTPDAVDFASFRPIDVRGVSGAPAEVFDFRDITTRYLTVQIEGCNQGGTSWTGCGVHEMVFAEGVVTGAVPEPATWAMMILGFGGVGATIRRRRAFALA